MDTKHKGKIKLPHLSWSGPQPHSEIEAYALAMVVRMVGTSQRDRTKRTLTMAPSVLTTSNIKVVAQVYAFYCSNIRDIPIKTNEKLLQFLTGAVNEDVWKWAHDNKALVSKAEAELIEMVETANHGGFRVFG